MDPISILNEGAKAWNEWRKSIETGGGLIPIASPSPLGERFGILDCSPTSLPNVDIRGAHLKNKDLAGADLSGLDLSGVNFSRANLNEAKLFGTVFHKANLSGANLEKADLYSADLLEADFSYANLAHTDLRHSKLVQSLFKKADLTKANLTQCDFSYSDFSEAKLSEANIAGGQGYGVNFTKAYMSETVLSGSWFNYSNFFRAKMHSAFLDMAWIENSTLKEADLSSAKLLQAHILNCDLTNARLVHALLEETNLQNSVLSHANLNYSILIKTNLDQVVLSHCLIYGISAWDVLGEPKDQSSLIITGNAEATITVDDLQIAQFIYLLLDNKKIRNVIDTITSKVVLILGRFTGQRKKVLDTLHAELRKRNYLPVLFDFDKPKTRDITETIATLAHLSRFIIADITDARSIPQELQAIVPDLPSVPVQPILLSAETEYGMFEHFKRYSWVLETYYYTDITVAPEPAVTNIINLLENKYEELRNKNMY